VFNVLAGATRLRRGPPAAPGRPDRGGVLYVRGTVPARWQAKTLVVNNAVAVRPLEPSARRPRRFVFLGQLNRTHAWKGLDQVLAACAQCSTSDAPVELVVGVTATTGAISGGGDAPRPAWGQLSRLDRRRREALPPGDSDGNDVYPTTCNDALPTVILESWEAGTPVVASRIGALPSIVKDASDGLLVEPGTRAHWPKRS